MVSKMGNTMLSKTGLPKKTRKTNLITLTKKIKNLNHTELATRKLGLVKNTQFFFLIKI